MLENKKEREISINHNLEACLKMRGGEVRQEPRVVEGPKAIGLPGDRDCRT